MEACGTVAGACLEPKTWLGRNLAVKEDVDVPQEDSEGTPYSRGFNSIMKTNTKILNSFYI